MFYVKVKLKQSALHGIGLFADENISKGKKIYFSNQKLNLILSIEEFSKLSRDEKKTIRHYGYFDKIKKQYHLSFDDIRFCNHSFKNNLIRNGLPVFAKRDIKKGEELTHDYTNFENPIGKKRGIIR